MSVSRDRRERAIVSILSVVLVSPALLADVVAAQPTQAPPTEGSEADPAVRADGARVVERDAVPISIPTEGGEPLAGPALDPSVGFRGRPTIDGLPTTGALDQPTELEGWRTENSRSILNPDGTITAEYSGGRLNYRDEAGDWQPLDLSLLRKAAPGGYEIGIGASDRDLRLSADDIEDALAELSAGGTTVRLRAIDFKGVLTPPAPTAEEPAEPAEPAPSASPEPSPSPQPPPEPSPTAEPSASSAPAASPSAGAQASPPPGSTGPPAPEPSSAPTPSAVPSASPTASASPTPTETATPTPIPAPGGVPDWVLERNEVRFAADPGRGTIVAQPTDTGFEFSVVLDDASQAPTYAFAIDIGSLEATLGDDGRSIVLERVSLDPGGPRRSAAGSVSAPIVLDGDGTPAAADVTDVSLYRLGDPGLPPGAVSAAAVAALRPSEILVVYSIDPAWLADPDRVYPVTLDPTVCIQVGGSGCDTTAFEHYVGSGETTAPSTVSMLRVGYDAITTDSTWDHLRGMVYFGDVALPDGAQVVDATLDLRQSDNRDGSLTPKIQARLLNKPWGSSTGFPAVEWAWETPYNSPTYSPCSSSTTTDCDLTMNVEKIVRAWYTRRGADWRPNLGISLVHEPATVGWEETDFYLSTNATVSNRPKLTIDYFIPAIEIDFPLELGKNYAPSTLVAAKATTMRLLVDNNSASAWGLCTTTSATDCSTIGYRFFNAKGKVEGTPGYFSGGGGIAAGADNAAIDLLVTPPATPGAYTLRLDYVRLEGGWGGTPVWGSDYAQPSKYYSRDKKILAADNTRWTGTSVIERDEFQVSVVTGGGTSVGEQRDVELGDGSSLGINLYSGNLHYEGSGGIGFDDLIPLDLTYGYDSANAATDCATSTAGANGILDACGWYTNWDERITPDPNTAGIYSYQGPSGNRYQVDTDGNGQLISGAPVLLERVRYTGFDENVPVNATGTSTPTATQPAFVNGAAEGVGTAHGDSTYIAKVLSANTTLLSGLGKLDLNAYQHVKFAIRTNGDTTSGVSFQVQNISDPGTYPVRWFTLTTGSAWTPPHEFHHIGGTIHTGWSPLNWVNLYDEVRTNPLFGKPDHSYQVVAVQIQSNGGTGYTYLDALRFLGNDTAVLTDSEPVWSQNGGNAELDLIDFVEGTRSLKVLPSSGALAPSCQATCFTTLDPNASGDGDLYAKPFVSWSWRKAGGTSVAMEFNLQDTRTNAVGQITYYAGPAAPAGATNPIQVSDTVPVTWTKVTRNVLEDGRQVLNFFNDSPTGTTPGSPPSQGPSPDEVRWIGVKPWAPDGVYALVDNLRFGSIPRRDNTDTEYANDYVANYADGSEHWFNRDGLLEEVVDRDGNTVALDWSNSATVYGQDGYTLNAIHAATDGSVSGANTYNRQIDVAAGTFTEKLGTVAAPITGRSTAFTVSSGNVTTIRPARTPGCAGSSPTGCVSFTYTGTHLLDVVSDPRWNGGSGANDFRYDVEWSGTSAVAILDRSKGNAAQLKVVSSAIAPSPASHRILWQDAAAVAAGAGIYTDLTSDGSVLHDHAPLACGGGASCAPSTASLASNRTVANEFDGLARVSTQKQFSAGGAKPLVSRQGTKAAAKVDNYNDPLAAGGVAWTQSPDQHYASLVDSAGDDPDLYRTFKTYDSSGNELTTTTSAYNARPDYAKATSSIPAGASLKAYWRLGEASGSQATNSAAGGTHGTYANAAYSRPGALVGDANSAIGFNGSTSAVSLTSAFGTVSGTFTVSAWARPAVTNANLAILGSRTGGNTSFDMKLMNGNLIHGDIGNGLGTWMTTSADAPFEYEIDRWYHFVYVVTPAEWRIYANGQLVSRGTYQNAGTPALTDGDALLRIGNNGTAEHFQGDIDEVAVYTVALTSAQVLGTYQAGRSIARHTARTTYDGEGHPLQVDDQFLVNQGFESGLDDWDVNAAASADPSQAHPPLNSLYPQSRLSYKTGIGGNAQQDVQLVPGQTVRLQLWEKRTGAANGRISLYYWRRSDGSWQSLVNTSKGSAAWASHAWDVTLPFDTDGRVRLALWQSSGSGTDSVWFDDVAMLSSYARTKYLPNGLTDYAYTFSPTDATTGDASGEIALHPIYGATSVHPAIFATTSIANDILSPSGPDQDVTSSATYDAWGRTLTSTDPDGVTTESRHAASGNGAQTDVEWTEDGLNNRTTMTYDLVGNPLTQRTPLGRTTTTTYDLAGHATSVRAATGVLAVSDYNTFGQLTATWTNRVNGNPDGGAGIDDVKTSYGYDAFGRVTTTTANDGGGAAQARTVTAYDTLGRTTSTTAYGAFDGSTFSAPRLTEARPDLAHGVTRSGMSASRGPIVPGGSPAPTCPDGTGNRCNSLTGRDINGQPVSLTDAYGKVTRTFNDLAGRPVIVVANHVDGVYSTSSPDTDLVAITQFDTGGRAAVTKDVLGRSSIQTFDGLGRSIKTVSHDSAGAAVTKVETVYTPGGRVDRVSRPAANADAPSAMTWTKTVYDGAGRAIKTLDHYDIGTDARFAFEPFEQAAPDPAWVTSAFGSVVAGGASLTYDDHYNWAKPASGRGRLRVNTTTAAVGQGASWQLPGTFKAGRTYRVRALVAGVAGHQVGFRLGSASSGSAVQTVGTAGGWTYVSVDFTWTPGADTTGVRFSAALADATASVYAFYLDDVIVWDTSSSTYWNIPTETAYDADGRVIESILPPGDPAVDGPLVTETAYDAAGRVVTVAAANRREVPGRLLNTAGVTAYWPLDEAGISAIDRAGAHDLTAAGGIVFGVGGAITEGRTATRFDGTASLSRASNVTSISDGFSMEAWVRTDAAPAANAVVARNGDGTNGWGLGVTTSGHIAGAYEAAGTATWLATTKVVADGAWHHVVLVRSGGTTTIYVDGVAYSVSNATTAPGTPGAGFSVGRESAAGGQYFAGDLDELAVYASPLSSGDVAGHFGAGRIAAADANLATHTAYDALGRATDAWDPTRTRTRYAYDRLGRITATTLNHVDGVTSSATGDDDVRSTFAYNAAGELVAYCPARNVQSADACDPTNTTTTSNAYKSAWHYAFNAAGLMVQQVPPVATTVTQLATKVWEYDAGSRLTKACDAPASATTCTAATRNSVPTYDGVGRVTVLNTYSGAATTLALRTETTYLGDGSVKQTKYSEGTTPTLKDTLDYAYDTAGRLDQLKRGATVLSDFGYNADGTIASRLDGDANGGTAIGTSTFTYDWADRLASVDLPSGFSTGVPTFAWRADGLIGRRTWDTGAAATFSYDKAKRPVGIDKGSLWFDQAYDRDGNVTAEARNLPGVAGDPGSGSQSFSYDALNRVTASSGLADSQSYTYDLDGNRLTRTIGGVTHTSTYDRTDQLIGVSSGGSPTLYGYDTYGNLTSNAESVSSVTTMTYDLGDKLTGINPTGTADDVTFTFDALGRFRTRVLASSTDTYSYAGTSEVVQRIANSGGTTTDSIVSPAGDRLGVSQGGTLNWFMPDLHGNVAASLSATEATVTSATRYDPYGHTIGTGTAGGTAVGQANWKYQGRLDVSADADAPLYDMSARFYSPGLGTFTQLDSVMGGAQNPLSMNRFLYAHANPATLIDPTGHSACPYGPDDCAAIANSSMSNKKPWQRASYKPGIRKQQLAALRSAQRKKSFMEERITEMSRAAKWSIPGYGDWKGWSELKKQSYALAHGELAMERMRNGAFNPAMTPALFEIASRYETRDDHARLVHLYRGLSQGSGMGEDFLAYVSSDELERAKYSPDAQVAQWATYVAFSVGGPSNDHLAQRPSTSAVGRPSAVSVRPTSACGGHSFSGDTLVATPSGLVPIADLEVGNGVTAHDPGTGIIGNHTVVAVHIHNDRETLHLEIDGEMVHTTPSHLFLTEEGWREAAALWPGTRVSKLDGTFGTVDGYWVDLGPGVMWDLTVSDVHTFAVGSGGWIVHNCDISRPASFHGASAEDARAAVPQSWGPGTGTRDGGGTRWFAPGTKGSDGIRIMPGDPGAADPMHQGPYVIITRHGKQERIPLAGNPVLGDQR